MNVLVSFEKEIIDSNKTFSSSQTTQFMDRQNNLKQVSSLITELKAEHSAMDCKRLRLK